MTAFNSIASVLLEDILSSIEAREYAAKLMALPQLEVSNITSYDREADAFAIDFKHDHSSEYVESAWIELKKGTAIIDFDKEDHILGIQVLKGKSYYESLSGKST